MADDVFPSHLNQVSIEDEMRKSYLDYSMSVIVGRALPDVRDGLKPVHRRVLYAMRELGNTYNAAYKKSARVAGDVVGKYHPHGEQAVYDTIVRMAQPWSMRYTLIDGQGNFGSIDGDAPAAMRYTEIRMERLTDELLQDLEKQTVDFSPNYDGTLQEPVVLPAKFPNLFVNGSDGIAVGMTTKVPPHNLGEVIDATMHLLDFPKATISELMRFVQGPDFPTYGLIAGREGIRRAYETGRGQITMRARSNIELEKRTTRESIIITEIPYQLKKEQLVKQIADLVRDKRIDGIHDIRDESSMKGMRIVVELKRDAIADIVRNNLYANTAMQSTYGIIMLAIDKGQPRMLTLKGILECFILHRREAVTRRTHFELQKAKARLHIVEGLLVASCGKDMLDHVIGVIRASQNPKEAHWALMHIASPALYEAPHLKALNKVDMAAVKASMHALATRAQAIEPTFQGIANDYEPGFSEEQATRILEMRLQRLTGLQQEELFQEWLKLSREIAEFEGILLHEATLLNVIKTELQDIRARHADARRTEIIDEVGSISTEDLIADEAMVVTLSHAGYVKRTPSSEYRAQHRGGRGKTAVSTKEEDFIENIFIASTHAYLMPITTRGRLYWLKVHEIPLGSRASRGKPIVNLVHFGDGERLARVLVTREFEENKFVLFVTRNGVVKRTDLAVFSNVRTNGIVALGIEDGDALVTTKITDGTKDVLMSTAKGMSIRFNETSVRSMGRSAYGVKGITLAPDDAVVNAEIIDAGTTLLTVTEKGYGKRTHEMEYRTQSRGGKGVIDIKTTERNGPVVAAVQVQEDDEVMLVTSGGILIRMRVKEINVIGRNTQGVRLITLDDAAEKVVGLSHLPQEETPE